MDKLKLLNYMKTKQIMIALFAISLMACKNITSCETDLVADNVTFATQQIGHQVKLIEKAGQFINPRTIKDDKIQYIPFDDWTSGFFPGTMWYMYKLTGDEKWKNLGNM